MKKSLFVFVALAALVATTSRTRAGTPNRKDLVERVETCEAILREFQADPQYAIPKAVLAKARGLVVVNQFKGGFIIGVQDGYGTVMVKRQDGTWSVPALIRAGEASFGLQLGAKSVETIYVITDDSTPRLIFNQRFNIGVDAKAVAGPNAAESEAVTNQVLRAPVLVYSRKVGLYAGATVKSSWIARNDDANFLLYNTTAALPELLYGNQVKAIPDIKPFLDYVAQITR